MITKKAIKKIHLKVLTEKVAPILKELGFKFIKSKTLFIKSGNEIDIVIKSYINSSSLIIDQGENLTFQINLRSHPKLTQFSKWHKDNLGTDSRDLTNSININSEFVFDIHDYEFVNEDFYDPTTSQKFKNHVTQMLSTIPANSKSESQLHNFITKDVVPTYQTIDKIEEVLVNDRIPLYMKPKLIAYSGDMEKSKSEYRLIYHKTHTDLQSEERDSIQRHYESELSKMEQEYSKLFNEQIKND